MKRIEFNNKLSAKDRLQDKNLNQVKLKVNGKYKKMRRQPQTLKPLLLKMLKKSSPVHEKNRSKRPFIVYQEQLQGNLFLKGIKVVLLAFKLSPSSSTTVLPVKVAQQILYEKDNLINMTTQMN